MRSSKKLQPMANLAVQKERRSARHHGGVLREFQQQQHQLDELIQYRSQYIEKFEEASKAGLPIEKMREFQAFLSRLTQAITAQRQQVEQKQVESDQSQSDWKDKRGRSKMMNKVVEQSQQAENKIAAKREQSAMDDLTGKPSGG